MRRKIPNVDFGKQDLQDAAPGARVTAETVLRAYMPRLDRARVYSAYVPVEVMPEPQLAEQDEVDDDGCSCGYPWEDFRIGHRPFPPVKLHRDRGGRLTILDGNHRTLFWAESGYTHIPAWVIDEAVEPPEWYDADDE